MADDVLLNKAASIERCVAALDMGQQMIRRDRLGAPQSAHDIFELLAQAGHIDATLAVALKKMVGFRSIAVHQYQSLQVPILVAIIERHLDELLDYSRRMMLAG